MGQRAMNGINLMSALAAGIVFGSFLCHIIPGADDAFAAYWSSTELSTPLLQKLADFPWGPMLTGVGFIVLVFVDRVQCLQGMVGQRRRDGGGLPRTASEARLECTSLEYRKQTRLTFNAAQMEHPV